MIFSTRAFEPGPRTLVAAHRGARSLAPENTLLAARTAHARGADLWELDVRPAADGELVVFHDPKLTRTTDAARVFPGRAPWTMEEFSLAELGRLDAGSWFVRDDPFGRLAAGEVPPEVLAACPGQRIPTLAQALELTRDLDWAVNLELKGSSWVGAESGSLVSRLVDLVRRSELLGRVLVSSFQHPALARVRALEPALPLGVLVNGPVAEPERLLARLGARTLHLKAESHPPQEVARLQAKGLPVMIWTVNEPARMKAYLEAGTWALCTDFPQDLAGPGREGGAFNPD